MKKKNFERPMIQKLNLGMPNKFGTKTEFLLKTHIDTVPVKELLNNHGSPLFVISERTLRETYREAKRAFSSRYPKVQFAWSYKTNYLDAVCRVFHQEGSWAEVVSRFEYEKALSNGVPGNKIIFNGPDKTADDLCAAAKNGSYIHIDHFDELYTLIDISSECKEKPKVAVRVNMDTGVYPMWDRFGLNYENGEAWEAINRIMLSDKLELVGLHTHIGTFMLTANAYSIAAGKLADLAFNIRRKYNHKLQYIDMGGGFASQNTLKGSYLAGIDTSPGFDEYAEAISAAIINSQIPPDSLPILILETGRALVDDAGSLLGTVIAIKKLSDGRRSTIVDFGVNILFTSFWYEHIISPAQEFSSASETGSVYGPLCMNIDVIRESVTLPSLKKGDNVVVSRIGAYNMTQWMQFITLRPAVVMIDESSNVHVIRKAETLDAIQSFESVPEHLK